MAFVKTPVVRNNRVLTNPVDLGAATQKERISGVVYQRQRAARGLSYGDELNGLFAPIPTIIDALQADLVVVLIGATGRKCDSG